MDIEEYIKSGTLESYVTGTASDQERREVECLGAIYPEIKQALNERQVYLEKYARSISIAPPASLKSEIMKKIRGMAQEDPAQNQTANPKIVSLPNQSENQSSTLGYWKVAAALAIFVLLGVAYQYSQLDSKLNRTQKELISSQKESQDELNSLRSSLQLSKAEQAILLDSSTLTIRLKGTGISPKSQARVFWNRNQKAFVLIADNLPEVSQDKQYQLWAIADGQPVDLGTLENNLESSLRNLELEEVEAFAITLEKAGGVKSPTLEAMYVMGAV